MAKKKINSRAKGARGERELANYLKEKGYESRRGQQFSGGDDSPDVVSTLPFHIECKRVQSLSLYKALAQATRDAENGKKPPLVIHRKDNEEWVAILKLDDFIDLVDKALENCI